MRKSFKAGFLILLCIVLTIAFTDRSGSAPTLSQSKAEQIAKEYFLSTYAMEVSVVRTDRKRMGEHTFWNCVRVSDGQREYALLLDSQNRPYADDVMAQTALTNFDLTMLEGRLEPLGLSFASATVMEHYKAALYLDVVDLPLQESAGDLWHILKELETAGLDELCLTVCMPKPLRQGVHGTRLHTEIFATDLTEAAFQTAYSAFCEAWNK